MEPVNMLRCVYCIPVSGSRVFKPKACEKSDLAQPANGRRWWQVLCTVHGSELSGNGEVFAPSLFTL